MKIIDFLISVEPFNVVSDKIKEDLKKSCIVKDFEENTLIFSEKDTPSGYLYFIYSGAVEIVSETDEGVEIPVDYRKSGEFFGWTPIFTDGGYSGGARTVEKTTCLLIPKALILKIANEYPSIARYFSKAVFSRIKKLYQDVVTSHLSDPVAHIEAYPFQKRVRDIMSNRYEICDEKCKVIEIAKIFAQKGLNSILICDNDGKLKGIITERDLVTKVLAKNLNGDLKEITASEIMTPNPYFVSPDTFMYEASAFMIRHNIRHLPVVENDKVVGIVTIQDLMKFRSQKTVVLVGKAKEAKSLEELASIKERITSVAKVLLLENRSHAETMEIISYIHHSIIRRCFDLTLQEMLDNGYTLPDIKYSFIIMGSGGRKEMLLGPDQDNGFIFEDYSEELEGEVSSFFIPFSNKLVKSLDKIGYPLCKGKVMVSNPMWRGKISEWKKKVSKWIRVPEPQRVRYSSIFFDLMSLVGDAKLCEELKDHIYREIKENLIFLYKMMELDYKHKVPLGLLNRFVTSNKEEYKGQLSVKENGSIFIVDCIRMYCLENGIRAQSTTERIDQLEERKIFNQATLEHIRTAFDFFTYIRLKNEIKLVEQGKKPSHYLDPYELPKEEQELLKEAFKVADKLQDTTRRHFARIIGQ